MTLATSLFNLGIYKNTLHRFKWGSFLYFIALFFSVPFVILVSSPERMVETYALARESVPILLRGDFMFIPALLAVAVPTVVAVLVFNNVHSTKQSIFVHSLPVTRKENYISNILAAFTLMAIPVLLNAVILLVMSFTAFNLVVTSGSVIYWALLNLSMLFVMFSFSAFTAFLTGNTATHIVLNVFMHIIPILVALTVMLISDAFLFGFVEGENFFANELVSNTPIVWLFGKMTDHYGKLNFYLFKQVQMWLYLVGAVVVYVLGYILYKNRKIETSGDVVAYKVFRPIFKYSITTAAAVGIFAILYSVNINTIATFVVAAVVTAVVYFACEMLMNKSFRVFKAYKGYVGFVVCCGLFIAFFAYTHVLGYETRIPEPERIEGAAVYQEWIETTPVSTDPGVIADTREIHKNIIKNIPVTQSDDDDRDNDLIRIEYRLKNGKRLERRYKASAEVCTEALSKMYKNTEYKLKATGIDNINIENLTHINLGFDTRNSNYCVAINDEAPAVMEAIKKDIEELSYAEIKKQDSCFRVTVDFDCTVDQNKVKKIFKNVPDSRYGEAYLNFWISINPSFKHTYSLLQELGYYEQGVEYNAQELWLCKKPISRAGDIYTYKGDTGGVEEFLVNPDDCVKLEPNDAVEIVEIMASTLDNGIAEGENYAVFNRLHDKGENMLLDSACVTFNKEYLPESLKKYIQD